MPPSPVKAFRWQTICASPPSNNHTFILLILTPPAIRAVCLIREGESLLFPVPADQFPVLIYREFVCRTLKSIYDLMLKLAKCCKKSKFPVIFPVLREFGGKE
jgi:hypothetical protein